MATLILYKSRHGTTRKVAYQLKGLLKDEQVDAIELKKFKSISLLDYDFIIIGASIHMGNINIAMKSFLSKNIRLLLTKKIGLFICCMEEGEKAQIQFDNAYDSSLRNSSVANGIFGGEFLFEQMNFLERLIIKKQSGYTHSVSKLHINVIEQFAKDINARGGSGE